MVSVISSEFPKILFSDMWYDSKRLSACLISSASFILAVQQVESQFGLSFLTRDWPRILVVEAQSLNRWPAREVPCFSYSYFSPLLFLILWFDLMSNGLMTVRLFHFNTKNSNTTTCYDYRCNLKNLGNFFFWSVFMNIEVQLDVKL